MNKYILIINTDYEPSSFYAFESSKSFRELNDQLLSELSRLKKVRKRIVDCITLSNIKFPYSGDSHELCTLHQFFKKHKYNE